MSLSPSLVMRIVPDEGEAVDWTAHHNIIFRDVLVCLLIFRASFNRNLMTCYRCRFKCQCLAVAENYTRRHEKLKNYLVLSLFILIHALAFGKAGKVNPFATINCHQCDSPSSDIQA